VRHRFESDDIQFHIDEPDLDYEIETTQFVLRGWCARVSDDRGGVIRLTSGLSTIPVVPETRYDVEGAFAGYEVVGFAARIDVRDHLTDLRVDTLPMSLSLDGDIVGEFRLRISSHVLALCIEESSQL
jgi:hypothetical protein